jgi:thioredoxin 1
MTREMTQANFAEIISSDGIVLVDCWAPWCRNCDQFAEEYRKAANKHPAATFATLDTQEQKELRDQLGIQQIPSLIVFREGVLLFKQPGSFPQAELENIVAQAESLDMDEVRAELAARAAQEGSTAA